MKNIQKVVTAVFAVILCLMFTVSVMDTQEVRHDTDFDQERILTHIENLTANGPRSIADTAANQSAVRYFADTLESYGLVNEDTTQAPAYLIQDYVTSGDERYQDWYLQNVIVHIPANADTPTEDAIMFMGHFDSVPMGNGASDDGVACSVMLEAIRYYLEQMDNGYTLSNDLVFCFVNGEEYSLYGSEAFMNEFTGFDDITKRIRFGTNLESRGTQGTLIMFETAKNNYNTVKLFAQVNESLFTCSIATMVYDIMPNSTDFTSFKEAYQGLNMANLLGGENYHTQNDTLQQVGESYLSQQAQIVDALIDKLSAYDLNLLYDATESAHFFSYLNIATVVYNHTASIVLGVVGLLLLVANVLLSFFYRKQHHAGRTTRGILTVIVSVVLTAGVTYACYYLFQYIAVLAGNIDIHAVGSITYSNTAIVLGIGIVALAMTALSAYGACRLLKVSARDLHRALAYIHTVIGGILCFVLPDAGYLFIFSGILLTLNELLITVLKNTAFENYHGELLASALYFPILIPVIVLATSALGLTMAYVYGAVFALGVFGIGVSIVPICRHLSFRTLIAKLRRKTVNVSAAEGALHMLAAAMVIFLIVSLCTPNAGVNLLGKQNIATLPYDDALVYVVDESGDTEYRIYDLNAVAALKAYAPDMTYTDSYYVGEETDTAPTIEHEILSEAQDHVLQVRKTDERSLVYLTFSNTDATAFTVDDGTTCRTYTLGSEEQTIKLHSDCTVTVLGGNAQVSYREVIRDYESLIPAAYAQDDEALHFNLWLTKLFSL